MKKTKLPSKQTLNLMIKVKTLAHPTRLIPILLLIFVFAAAFAKFAVINRLEQVKKAEAELAEMHRNLEMIESTYADYDEVQKEYNRYTYQNFDRSIADRLDVLSLIERQIFPISVVQSLSISDKTVSMTINGLTLEQASTLLDSLLSEPLVADVDYSSYVDNTDRDQGGDATTTITMTITLADASEVKAAEKAAEAEENGGAE